MSFKIISASSLRTFHFLSISTHSHFLIRIISGLLEYFSLNGSLIYSKYNFLHLIFFFFPLLLLLTFLFCSGSCDPHHHHYFLIIFAAVSVRALYHFRRSALRYFEVCWVFSWSSAIPAKHSFIGFKYRMPKSAKIIVRKIPLCFAMQTWNKFHICSIKRK